MDSALHVDFSARLASSIDHGAFAAAPDDSFSQLSSVADAVWTLLSTSDK